MEQINDELKLIEEVSTKHALHLNPPKSMVIHFSNRGGLKVMENHDTDIIQVQGKVLPVMDNVRNLGLYFDSSLRFKKHTSTLIQSCYAKLYINLRISCLKK